MHFEIHTYIRMFRKRFTLYLERISISEIQQNWIRVLLFIVIIKLAIYLYNITNKIFLTLELSIYNAYLNILSLNK